MMHFSSPTMCRGASLLIALAFCPSLAGQTTTRSEFSADMLDQAGHVNARIYVAKGKVRIEPTEGGSERPVYILDLDDAGRGVALMPVRRTYVDLGTMADAFRGFGTILRPADPSQPCAEFTKFRAESARSKPQSRRQQGTSGEVSCKSLGSDTVNGRRAQKWETHADGETGYLWIDPALGCFVKVEAPSGLMELRSIKEGSQPAALFEVPATYTKIETGRQ